LFFRFCRPWYDACKEWVYIINIAIHNTMVRVLSCLALIIFHHDLLKISKTVVTRVQFVKPFRKEA